MVFFLTQYGFSTPLFPLETSKNTYNVSMGGFGECAAFSRYCGGVRLKHIPEGILARGHLEELSRAAQEPIVGTILRTTPKSTIYYAFTASNNTLQSGCRCVLSGVKGNGDQCKKNQQKPFLRSW